MNPIEALAYHFLHHLSQGKLLELHVPKLMEDTPDAEKMSSDILNAVTGSLTGNSSSSEVDELVELDNQMKEMLLNKINKMLDVLDNKQTTSRKLLKTKLAG